MNYNSNIYLSIIYFANIEKLIDIPITILLLISNLTYTLQTNIQVKHKRLIFIKAT